MTIDIVNDDILEPTETFELVMVPDNNLFAVKPVGIITILDDDTCELKWVGGVYVNMICFSMCDDSC